MSAVPLIEAKQAIATLPIGDELVINFDCTQATDSDPAIGQPGLATPLTDFRRVGDASWTIAVRLL